MLPFVFEGGWEAGRLIFMGLLYLVLGAIGLGLFYAFAKTWLEMRNSNDKFQMPNETG